MTRKHYKRIAEILVAHRDHIDPIRYAYLIEDMAGYLAEDNPRFDRTRFIEACGWNA